MSQEMHQPTTLLLVRHGETDANLTGTWQGSTDSPLNNRGEAQSQSLAQRLVEENRAINAIYSSPLRRAYLTAEVVADALKIATVERDLGLAEFDLGDWEGLSYEHLRQEKKLWHKMAADPSFAPPGGESAISFATRLVQSFRRIAERHSGQTVLVVSHGGAIATALAMIIDQDPMVWPTYQMDNCGLSELRMQPQPHLGLFNDVSHLGGMTQPHRWSGP